jgi:glycogen operon protein
MKHEEQRVSLTQLIAAGTKAWHGVKLDQPDFGENSHAIAFTVKMAQQKILVHMILNAYWEPLEFELPAAPSEWRRWIDTSLSSPDDIVDWKKSPPAPGRTYRVGPRSVVVLHAALADN